MAKSRHVPTSMSAPVGGLNVVDAIQNMGANDAIELTNWIPQEYGVRSRKGYREWCIDIASEVKSVLFYQPDDEDLTSEQRFAVTDNGIHEATTVSNNPPLLLALSGELNSGRFTSTMFSNSAGSFLLACSHEGGYFKYDGSNWAQIQSGTEAGAISGIDPNSLCFVMSWKRKLWFIEKDSSNAWYLPTDSITGEARKFELGPFIKNGGRLSIIVNWTIDAGEGIDDLIAFVFEGGDVLVYKGSDPNSAVTFGLVGQYNVGRIPPGRRGFCSYGGDVLIMSELGIQPLSYVTRGGQSLLRTNAVDYLKKIQPRVTSLFGRFGTLFGWEMFVYPKENLLIFTVPSGSTNVFNQYAMYTNTGAWCMFDGIPGYCFAPTSQGLWFGDADGRVCKALDGNFDDIPYDGVTGFGITGKIQPGFSYFGLYGKNKQFHMVRPTFLAVDGPGVQCRMATDYQVLPSVGIPAIQPSNNSAWDTAVWDTAKWGGSLNVYADWVSVEGLGYTGSLEIRTNAVGGTLLSSIDYIFEFGGSL